MKTKFLNIIIALTILFLTSFAFMGCSGTKVKKVNIDTIQNITIDEKWGIITTPYATFYENPEISKNSTIHGRKGDIVKVYGKKVQILEKDERMIWYKLENGWCSENDIFICTNRLQAEKYAKSIALDEK